MRNGAASGQLALVLVPGLGPMELVLIVFALLLIFGAKRIPQIARGVGEGIRDFKTSLAAKDEKDGEPPRLEGGTSDDD